MLVEILTASRVVLSGDAASKDQVLAELSRVLAEGDEALAASILEGFRDREDVMSTGIGQGIALPHARLASITAMRLALVRYPRGVPFQALDDHPVTLAFGIIGPPQAADMHVKVLARIARLVRKPGAIAALLEATSPEGVLEILRENEA